MAGTRPMGARTDRAWRRIRQPEPFFVRHGRDTPSYLRLDGWRADGRDTPCGMHTTRKQPQNQVFARWSETVPPRHGPDKPQYGSFRWKFCSLMADRVQK